MSKHIESLRSKFLEKVNQIKEKTSINSLRKKYDDKEDFFRKGTSGDWINFLDHHRNQE